MFKWLARYSRSRKERQLSMAIAKEFGPCIICGKSTLGHNYYRMSSVITSTVPNRLEEFKTLITKRDWVKLATIYDWQGAEDENLLVAIKCPLKGIIFLKIVNDLSELWLDSHLLENIVLTPDEEKTILATIVGEKPAEIPENIGVFVVEQGEIRA